MLTHHVRIYEAEMIHYNVSVLYISVLFIMLPLFRNKDIDAFRMPMKTISLYLTVLFSLYFILSYYRVLGKDCLDLSVEKGWREVKWNPLVTLKKGPQPIYLFCGVVITAECDVLLQTGSKIRQKKIPDSIADLTALFAVLKNRKSLKLHVPLSKF